LWNAYLVRVQWEELVDAPPSSSMDSIASPRVKTAEGEEVGAHSLVCNTLEVERGVLKL